MIVTVTEIEHEGTTPIGYGTTEDGRAVRFQAEPGLMADLERIIENEGTATAHLDALHLVTEPKPTQASAWDLGYTDGYDKPEDLSSGITWDLEEFPDAEALNEAYDEGVNAGQRAGARERGLTAQADAEGYPLGPPTNPYKEA